MSHSLVCVQCERKLLRLQFRPFYEEFSCRLLVVDEKKLWAPTLIMYLDEKRRIILTARLDDNSLLVKS